MFCERCGNQLEDGNLFCTRCGAKVESVQNSEPKAGLSSKAVLIGTICLMLAALGIYWVTSHKDQVINVELTKDNLVTYKKSADEYPVAVNVYCAEDVIRTEEKDEQGSLLTGANVAVREGSMNYTGEVLITVQADNSGRISISLKSGVYTLQIDVPGYETSYIEIEVNEQETEQDAYVIPTIETGKTAVLLTWDTGDVDLDLAVYTPYQAEGGDMSHIGAGMLQDSYGNRLMSDNRVGCELVYLDSTALGNYKIYVNNYTDSLAGNYRSNALAELGACIYIYGESGFVTEYTFPEGVAGVVWEVAEISGNQVSSSNRVYSDISEESVWKRNKEMTPTEKALALYKEFLSGNITAGYQGEQILYNSLMCNIYDTSEIYEIDGSERPQQAFALTDSDKDNIPELQINFFDLSENGNEIYTIELQNNYLEIVEENTFGWSENITFYKDGSFKSEHGMSAVRETISFTDATKNPLAMFDYVYYDFCQELTETTVNEDYERWCNEGYEHVYVTSSDVCTSEEFIAQVDNFEAEHCGEVAEFHEVEESSIQKNIKWEENASNKDITVEELQERMETEVIPVYEQYVQENFEATPRYSFIYIDSDEIPELIVDGSYSAYGTYICTYMNGMVTSEYMIDGWFSVIEQENLLHNMYGKMGRYGDAIWTIQDGTFVCIAEGKAECMRDENGYEMMDDEGGYLGFYYYWNGQEVSEEAYNTNLAQVFDDEKSTRVDALTFYDTISEAYVNFSFHLNN